MILDWTSHLTDEKDKLEFASSVRNNIALKRLSDIVDDYERGIQRLENSLDTYNQSSWSHKQAHLNGMRAAYQKIKTLLIMDP